MNDRILDALEYCLRAIQDGASVEAVLMRYPDMADELRPLLETARQARELKGPGPSPDTINRTRARLIQQAAHMRPKRRTAVLPLVQRLGFSLALASVLLLSGTGLVRASSSTLPGDNLYPVKRTWEGVRLSFVANAGQRDALESEYEQERLDEVAQLLQKGRQAPITFSGLVTSQAGGQIMVSGVPVILSSETQFSGSPVLQGAAVIVTGMTDALGQVAAMQVQVLPSGSLVPVAEVQRSGTEGEGTDGHSSTFHLEGTVNSIQGGLLVVDGRSVHIDQAQMPPLVVGDMVEVKGYFTADGSFYATEVEIEHSDEGSPEENNGTETGQPEPGSDDSKTGEDHSGDEHSKEDESDGGSESHPPEPQETPESGD